MNTVKLALCPFTAKRCTFVRSKTTVLALVFLPIVFLTHSSFVFADWTTGEGVINFPTDEDKIIFGHETHSIEAADNPATRNTYRAWEWFAPGMFSSQEEYQPGNLKPNEYYTPIGDWATQRVTSSWPTFFELVSRTQDGIYCHRGQNCGSIGRGIAKSECNNVSVSFKANNVLSGGTLVKNPKKIIASVFKKLDIPLIPGVEFKKGWSTCTSKSERHICLARGFEDSPTITYATQEVRTNYGFVWLYADSGTIAEIGMKPSAGISGQESSRRIKKVCRQAGGKYADPWFRSERCRRVGRNVKWKDFGRYPDPFIPAIKNCRVVKG